MIEKERQEWGDGVTLARRGEVSRSAMLGCDKLSRASPIVRVRCEVMPLACLGCRRV